jgi:hypothetical protein
LTTSTTARPSTKEHPNSCIAEASGRQQRRNESGVGIFHRPSTHSKKNTYTSSGNFFTALLLDFQRSLLSILATTNNWQIVSKHEREQIVKQVENG